MKNSVRCQFVDIMKGWAMFVIIVFHAHNGIICNSVSELLHPWGVPVFFVLAGFFLKIEAMDTPIAFMKKKLKHCIYLQQ